MSLALIIVVLVAIVGLVIYGWQKRKNIEGELERHSVSPQELHAFIHSDRKVLIFDVRQALDLLAYPEQIPGHRGSRLRMSWQGRTLFLRIRMWLCIARVRAKRRAEGSYVMLLRLDSHA
jgi:hypothetical protein